MWAWVLAFLLAAGVLGGARQAMNIGAVGFGAATVIVGAIMFVLMQFAFKLNEAVPYHDWMRSLWSAMGGIDIKREMPPISNAGILAFLVILVLFVVWMLLVLVSVIGVPLSLALLVVGAVMDLFIRGMEGIRYGAAAVAVSFGAMFGAGLLLRLIVIMC